MQPASCLSIPPNSSSTACAGGAATQGFQDIPGQAKEILFK